MTNVEDIDIKILFDSSVDSLMTVSKQIEVRLAELEQKRKEWNEIQSQMKENAEKAKSKIILDVGGKIFVTSKQTLLECQGSYFYAMLSNDHWKPDKDGAYFIDRDPKYFRIILNYLRTKEANFDGWEMKELYTLKKELDYYQIQMEGIENEIYKREKKHVAVKDRFIKSPRSAADVDLDIDIYDKKFTPRRKKASRANHDIDTDMSEDIDISIKDLALDLDIDIYGKKLSPKLKTPRGKNVDVKETKLKTDIEKAPRVKPYLDFGIKAPRVKPDIDIKAPRAKPDTDIDIKAPRLKPDIDVDVDVDVRKKSPRVKQDIDIDIKAPRVKPDIDVDIDVDGRKKSPRVKPDIDVDTDIDVEVTKRPLRILKEKKK